MPTPVRVWDLPTRMFHWALVACVIGLVISGYRGGAAMEWHARIGYAVLTLLLFRIVWGFVGGRWSRFGSFIYSPRSVMNYLRGQAHPDHLVGHNPLGAGSVFAMIVVLLAQVGTGLIGDDEISFTGPLNKFVESSQGLAATWYHKRVGQWLILGLVALHICAVLYYLWKRNDNLIKPMIDGDKALESPAAASRDDLGSRVAALVIFGLCAGCVTWVVKLGS
ncbi:cytochrome b/b6 domain-containing protein [Caenimonas sp. SL110]|uniref:cytochrome b/b6 domain-containing protein n=1 Tax=Caenimonas sp. SL110 TaxID=1450524 RepID=UPI0006535DD7|nr:cytochrome b/b6 domain-containing protein [Caenimonas sp. SL110]